MKRTILLIFTFLCLIANSLYAATWEDFKANAKDAKFVYQHFFMDGGSIAYEFEYMLDGNPQSVFIADRKSKLIKPALRNLYIDIGTQGKRFGDKGFEVKDEADKAFVLDFLFAFAEYKEIYDTLKFFGKELSTPPTKDHPENMQERSNKYVKEMLKKNKEKRLEKDNPKVKFSVESLKALVVDSFKGKEIPEACFIGFAVYEEDTPTIIMHELKAGENECALPLNMSFRGTFEPTKSVIYDFKLSSPNKKKPQEIYFTSLATPKGFSIATAPTMLIQEENKTRPVLVGVFRYNNLNSENLDDSKGAEALPSEKKTSSKQAPFNPKKETPEGDMSEFLVDINKHCSNFSAKDGVDSTIALLKKHKDKFFPNKADEVCYFLLTWSAIDGVAQIKEILPLDKEGNVLTASMYKEPYALSFLGKLSQDEDSIKMEISLKQLKLEGFATESGLQNKGVESKAIFARKEINTNLHLPKDKSTGFILGGLSSERISVQEGVEVRAKETKGYGIFAIYPNN